MDESASSIKNTTQSLQRNTNISLTKKILNLQKDVYSSLINKTFANLSSRVGVPEGFKGNLVDLFA